MIKTEHLTDIDYVYREADCFQCVRKFMLDNFGIKIRDYAYPDEFWKSGLNLLMKHYKDEGFHLIDVNPREMQIGDVLMMAVGTEIATHLGVYLGNNEFLHHPRNRKSLIEPWRGVWRNCTVATVRHPDVKPSTSMATVDLMDLLPEGKRRELEEFSKSIGG